MRRRVLDSDVRNVRRTVAIGISLADWPRMCTIFLEASFVKFSSSLSFGFSLLMRELMFCLLFLRDLFFVASWLSYSHLPLIPSCVGRETEESRRIGLERALLHSTPWYDIRLD